MASTFNSTSTGPGGGGPSNGGPSTRSYYAGDLVKVHSLKAAPQYNGLSGVVAGPMHEGRHKVRVKLADGGIKLVQVKPSNLKEGNPVMEMLMNAKEKGPDGMANMDNDPFYEQVARPYD